MTRLFFHYYYQAEPFDVEALRAIWRTCLDPRCAKVRQDAERRLSGTFHPVEAPSSVSAR